MINRRAEMNRRRATEAEALVKFARALVPMSASFPPFPMLRQKMGGSLVNLPALLSHLQAHRAGRVAQLLEKANSSDRVRSRRSSKEKQKPGEGSGSSAAESSRRAQTAIDGERRFFTEGDDVGAVVSSAMAKRAAMEEKWEREEALVQPSRKSDQAAAAVERGRDRASLSPSPSAKAWLEVTAVGVSPTLNSNPNRPPQHR